MLWSVPRVKVSTTLFTVLAAIVAVSYFVEQDRQRTRDAEAQRYQQSRLDEQERVKKLDECVSAAENDYWQRSLSAAQMSDCLLRTNDFKCPPVSQEYKDEWLKQVDAVQLANKKIAIDVCIAAARK